MDLAKNGDKAKKILPPLLVVVLVFVALFQFYVDNRKSIADNSAVIMGDMSEQCSITLDNMFDADLSSIGMFSNLYADGLLNPVSRESELKRIEDLGVFNYVRFVDTKGVNYSSSGKQIDARDRSYYLNGVLGKSGVCYIIDSRQNTQTMVGFYAPVVKNERIEGVLVGFLSQEQLFGSLTREIYGSETNAYIISSDGTIIGASKESSIGKSIYAIVDYDLAAPLRKACQNMQNQTSDESILIQYSSSGVRNVAYLNRVWNSDGYFLQTYPNDIQAHINSMLGVAGEALFLKLVLIFVLYISYTFVINMFSSRRREEASQIVARGLSDDNDFVFLRDLSDGHVIVIKDSRLIPNLLVPLSKSNNIHSFFIKFRDTYVISADKEKFLQDSNVGLEVNALKDGIHRYACRVILDGKIYSLQWNQQLLIARRSYLMVSVRNVTDMAKKEMEEKKRLEDALESAEKATRAKSTFLANMSHDIRTPMNAIVGFTNMASTHIDDQEKVKDSLSKISVSSQHLLSLINDVLDMTRIEGGKIKLEESSTSLAEILNGLISITQTEIAQRSINFHIVAENVTHEDVVCDKLRLNQILLNCLSNAIKYTPEGGDVTLIVREIWDEKTDFSLFEFSVKDTGIGMAPEFLDHIFEPFERERNSTISGIQGTGLGMSITKNLVDLMGGQIVVRSEVGKGSEFNITVRLKHSSHEFASDLESYRGKKALVVGATSACRAAASSLFRLGLVVSSVNTVEDVLEQAGDASVVFVDHTFTDRYGLDLCRRIKELAKDPDALLILAFYHLSEEEKVLCKEHGVDNFILKPIFTSDFESILLSKLKAIDDKKDVFKNFSLKDKRVLVVEDNALNRDIAQFILTDAGMAVEFAENGQLGYECVRDHEAYYYDMVLMDIQMPVMNGIDSAKAIRALSDKEKAEVPIVAMTANAFEEDRKQTREAGMDAHIPKPIEIENLLMTMAEIFQRKSQSHRS